MLSTDNRELFFEDSKEEKRVTWLDHQPGCATCRAVDVAKPATLSLVCAIGAPLVMEELVRLNRPARKAKNVAVREWAEEAGFKTYRGDREAVRLATKYK
jgi:hypothetical protein